MTFDLKLSGTSVKTYAYIMSWDGLLSAGDLRGADLVIPGRDGESGVTRPRDAFSFSVPMEIVGTSQGNFQDNLDALRTLAGTGPITATRIKPAASGDVTTTCTARCRLSDVSMANGLTVGRVVLDVRNLDGAWLGSAATPTIPGTITVLGTALTDWITLTLPGAGTLTNSTTGTTITVTATATLNVRAKTSTGSLVDVVASGDALSRWFTLVPGSNTITWSGAGTPTISYQPAYL